MVEAELRFKIQTLESFTSIIGKITVIDGIPISLLKYCLGLPTIWVPDILAQTFLIFCLRERFGMSSFWPGDFLEQGFFGTMDKRIRFRPFLDTIQTNLFIIIFGWK